MAVSALAEPAAKIIKNPTINTLKILIISNFPKPINLP
ncbi:hypothetical protein PI172_2422 [Prevotella intermedia]|uniref:Uncharacterized protein n=1 Tax=Prevotella intermedia TaxID=28131 RepID=A0AAD1BKY2_PREIN|nr:hypothetical protein PI172_2422 [Prevotella intermedia]